MKNKHNREYTQQQSNFNLYYQWVRPSSGSKKACTGAIPDNPTIIKKIYEEMTKQMANQSNSNSSNQLLVPGVAQALDQMKYEIANEFGVNLGADTTSRANGSVGGEITKRLVQSAQQQMAGRFQS